jgi:L-histidine Nalpha-methyltransferase
LIVFLGGTIGNFRPPQRHRFLTDLRATMDVDNWLLLGTDLVKAPARLVAAYDDSAGVTAEFNRNVLSVLNNELGADFVLENFAHVARWNEPERWIEMWLKSVRRQTVRLEGIDLTVEFGENEEMLTEISAKFTESSIANELTQARLDVAASWSDTESNFLLSLARPAF